MPFNIVIPRYVIKLALFASERQDYISFTVDDGDFPDRLRAHWWADAAQDDHTINLDIGMNVMCLCRPTGDDAFLGPAETVLNCKKKLRLLDPVRYALVLDTGIKEIMALHITSAAPTLLTHTCAALAARRLNRYELQYCLSRLKGTTIKAPHIVVLGSISPQQKDILRYNLDNKRFWKCASYSHMAHFRPVGIYDDSSFFVANSDYWTHEEYNRRYNDYYGACSISKTPRRDFAATRLPRRAYRKLWSVCAI